MFALCTAQYGGINHMGLLSPQIAASAKEKLNFSIYLSLINLNINNHTWPVTTVLNRKHLGLSGGKVILGSSLKKSTFLHNPLTL